MNHVPAVSTYFQRNNWSKALTADRSQKTTARLIGGALGRHFKVGAGGVYTCTVSYEKLAEDAGCGRSTAIIAVAQLREGGWLAPATSQGRAANNFTLLMPSNGVKIYPAKHTTNGVTVHTVADVEIAEISDDPEISNGVTVHTPLKNNLQEDKIKKESQKGHRPDLALSVTRESNGFNAVNGTSETDAPIAPDFSSGIDAALHVPKPARETAMAARWNPICLKHKQQPELSANATSLDIGRGGFANGLLIDEAGNVIDEADEIETSSPDDRAPQSHYEAAYGDSQ
jgi:hypothetical protein